MIPVLAGRGRRSRNGELEASLGYMRSYLRKDKEGREKKKRTQQGQGKMAQQVKLLVTKPVIIMFRALEPT